MWPNRKAPQAEASDLEIVTSTDALRFRTKGVEPEVWLSASPNPAGDVTLWRWRTLVLKQWLAEGLAEIDEDAVRVSNESLYLASPDDVKALGLAPPCNARFALRAIGALHEPGFEIRLTILDATGRPEVGLKRMGCFVQSSTRKFLLGRDQFNLLKAVENFAGRGAEERNYESQLLAFTRIKGLAVEVSANLDLYLAKETAVAPAQFSVNLVSLGPDEIEIRAEVPGVDSSALAAAIDAHRDIPTVMTIGGADGSRQRIVAGPDVREGLRQVKRIRRLRGEAKREFIERPQEYLSARSIDLADFGDRVKAIGSYRIRYYPLIDRQENAWVPEKIGLTIASDDPERDPVEATFSELSEFEPVVKSYREAAASGRTAFPWGSWELPIDGDSERTIEAVREALQQRDSVRSRVAAEPPLEPEDNKTEPLEEDDELRTVLVIHGNLEEAEYKEEIGESQPVASFTPPSSLRPEVRLLKHQIEGFAWLQGLYQAEGRGALLADDMGLGKTLQILTFLAWYAENARQPKPIIVVAPVALLENWRDEYRKFLLPVFGEPLELHGTGLAEFRYSGAGGREYLGEGKRVLDREQIASHRLILTTYEAVRDYQFSLAGIDWGVVVTDEAQKIKTPAALMTNAAKALKTDFRIAATGTPVENSLVDLWCIMDFCQPGLLGALKPFRQRFDQPKNKQIEGAEATARELRLLIGGGLMRRLKTDVLRELPPRVEDDIPIKMSAEQARQYLEVVEEYRARQGGRGAILGVLHKLRDISVHVGLGSEGEPAGDLATLERDGPKLAWVLDRLNEIRHSSEKALLFTEDRRLQRLLARLVEERFGFSISIVNGEVPGAGNAGPTRKRLIDAFQARPGFNTIVMSPLAVGFGLNITAANHVIHVTRLWNPAKEDQATDRSHRIGQTKPVSVCYPQAIDPFGRFASFDQTIARLLAQKRQLARNFLYPSEDLGIDLAELEALLLDRRESAEPYPLCPAPDTMPVWARGLPPSPAPIWVALAYLLENGWATEETLRTRSGSPAIAKDVLEFCRDQQQMLPFQLIREETDGMTILRKA